MCRGVLGLRVNWEEDDQFLGNVISVPPEIYAGGCVLDIDDGLAVSIYSKVIIMISSHLLLFSPKMIPFKQVAESYVTWCFFAGG